MNKTSDKCKKQAIKASDKINSLEGIHSKTRDNLQKIISYMENHHSVRTSEISEMLDLSLDRSRLLLKALVDEGCLSVSGKNKDRIYTLV